MLPATATATLRIPSSLTRHPASALPVCQCLTNADMKIAPQDRLLPSSPSAVLAFAGREELGELGRRGLDPRPYRASPPASPGQPPKPPRPSSRGAQPWLGGGYIEHAGPINDRKSPTGRAAHCPSVTSGHCGVSLPDRARHALSRARPPASHVGDCGSLNSDRPAMP